MGFLESCLVFGAVCGYGRALWALFKSPFSRRRGDQRWAGLGRCWSSPSQTVEYPISVAVTALLQGGRRREMGMGVPKSQKNELALE